MNIKTCSLIFATLLSAGTAFAQDDDAPSSRSARNYGNNIISLSPMQLTDEGAGLGIIYERVLDKEKNYISFYLPTAIAFRRFDNNGQDQHPTFYFMPGIKFYPTGGKGVVKYGLAANIVYATGKETYETYPGPFVQ